MDAEPRRMPQRRQHKCRPRKVPPDVRARIYQLSLTAHESLEEIAKLLTAHDVVSDTCQRAHLARIVEERGL